MLEVGAGKAYPVPSAAAAVVQNGDVVKISSGSYHGDVTTWSASNLTICGIGGRAKLYADGKNAGGKGIWIVGGSNVTIDGIEFHDASVPDQNGAGIRAENNGSLTILNCGFFDNENGILGPDDITSTVTIDRSEFARNGYGDGQSHNIYIGPIGKLTVTNSFFHEARIGHNLKSRARETHIQNSYFMDGPTGTASYQIDTPNGGIVRLRGNLLQKGPDADNSIAIAYGAEGLVWTTNTLELVHNTVVMTRAGGTFLDAASGTQSLKLTANLFAGTNGPGLIAGYPLASVVQSGNVTSTASGIPGADDLASPNFWPTAGLLAQLGLATVPDANYTRDAPRPFASRAISGGTRLAGALQSAP